MPRSQLPIPPPPPPGPPPATAKAKSSVDFLRQALASEVEDVHARMLYTGLAQTPTYPAPKLMHAAPKPSTSKPTPPPVTVPRGIVNGMIATHALLENTKHLIQQLGGHPAIVVTSSSSSTDANYFVDYGPSAVADNSEVIQFMCCCNHPVARARMCTFAYVS